VFICAGVHAAGAAHGAGLLLLQRQFPPAPQDPRLLAPEGGGLAPPLLAPGPAPARGLAQLSAT